MKIASIFLLAFVFACAPSEDFDDSTTACGASLTANASFSQVKNLYRGELLQIQEDWVIQGYVVSSDRAGNFFSVLHFQDSPADPSEGFEIEVDLFETHLLFEPGQKIHIKTKGLYLGQSGGVFKLGGTFAGFGTLSVGRLPATKIPEHIFRSCEPVAQLAPRRVTLEEVDTTLTNTLVIVDGVQFTDDELGNPFAEPEEETERLLETCGGNEIYVLNSGYADFQAEILPEGSGSVTAVLLRDDDDFFLALRDLDDLDLQGERCADPCQTSQQLFFSELADPNNNTGARFVELYNASAEPLNLEGWTIRRYTNANVEVGSTVDLTGLEIPSAGTLVISPNESEFGLVYGFAPDLGVGTNSPADSNGDDNLELVDPFGTVIDVFGVPGEDGTGTNHEFEDGKAVRNANITMANATYTFSEWTVFNDSGNAGTTDQPQNAPEDFNPGIRD